MATIAETKIFWPSLKNEKDVDSENKNNIKIKIIFYKTYKNKSIFKEYKNIT